MKRPKIRQSNVVITEPEGCGILEASRALCCSILEPRKLRDVRQNEMLVSQGQAAWRHPKSLNLKP